jgi:hypothetical protein
VGINGWLRRVQIGNVKGRSVRLLLAVADLVRWPFERAAWSFERYLLWPLQERLAGWGPTGRVSGVAALAASGVAAALVAVLVLTGDDAPPQQVATPTRVAIASPEPQPESERPDGPALRGALPSFAVGGGEAVGGDTDAPQAEAPASDAKASSQAGSESPPAEDGAAATSSSAKPVPAGPAAMKVARRFSEAFVFYEVGKRPERAKTVFGETATPELATALSERPPRLPQGAEVPKARVLNLVPGPRAGRAYTVSVSLLRVGLTTELRLELSKKQGAWLVTDVRG